MSGISAAAYAKTSIQPKQLTYRTTAKQATIGATMTELMATATALEIHHNVIDVLNQDRYPLTHRVATFPTVKPRLPAEPIAHVALLRIILVAAGLRRKTRISNPKILWYLSGH